MLVVYSKKNCPECAKAMALLDSKHIPYSVIKVDEDMEARAELIEQGHRSVPQIYSVVDDVKVHIGDYKTLVVLTSKDPEQLKNI